MSTATQRQRLVDLIRVALSWSGRESIQGGLRDLSARGPSISLSLPADRVPELPLGSIVAVSIAVPGADPLNNVMSIVRDQRFITGGCLLSVEIVDWTPVREVMPRELFALFSRRRYVRADTQRSAIPVVVAWDDDKLPVKGHLANVSASGCAVRFALGCAPEAGNVTIEFELPDSIHRYRLQGTIRSATDADGSTTCGIEFYDDHSHEFLAQQSRISHFVETRHREQILDLTNRFRALTIER